MFPGSGIRIVSILGIFLWFHGTDCNMLTDCDFFTNPKSLLKISPFSLIKPDKYDLSMKLYKTVLTQCANVDMTELTKKTKSRLIFPGTKWCGQGDAADNYDDLGLFSQTDACCREHDNCDDYLVSQQCRHNITNTGKYTKLKCSCDERFEDCLHEVNSLVSNLMGYIFFTILHSQCYELEYPVSSCERRKIGGFFRIYCEKYRLKEGKPKKWQWFDVGDWNFKLQDFNKNPLS